MGLDGVELVIAVEEEFAISIDDADAANLTTPRQLADYVFARLGFPEGDNGKCLSQAGFYRIRSALVRQFGAQRKDVRLDSRVQDFLKVNIRRQWIEFGKAIDAPQLPGLRCKKSIAMPLTFGIPLMGIILLLLGGAPGWALIAASFFLWMSALVITDKIADVVPEHLCTVGALVPYVRHENREGWTHDYVLQRVIQITAVQLDIPVEKIHPDHHFVSDLGLDS